jgi:hypothetical protein
MIAAIVLGTAFGAALLTILVALKSPHIVERIFEARAELKRKAEEGSLSAHELRLFRFEKWRIYLALCGCLIAGIALYEWQGVKKVEPPSNAEHAAVVSFFFGMSLCVPLLLGAVRVFRGIKNEKGA